MTVITPGKVQLGLQPNTLRVMLTTDADFYCTLRLNEDWPAGTVLSLVVGSLTWTATIGGADAVFSVDKAIANTVGDGATAKLVYTNGTTDQVWALGTVKRCD